ncbi:aspartyl-phosphate phosphatase Spo0E family protein [Cohnella sp. REN36]|uniref:aspartyl-phosphate phosphatase Spo0E family protein n=1 Tax=Cohnella sp. REN36 TaxID=2887347 RepID=UPI001D144814|nr:aspartyl-phosphate phosphatase Spo0E family protein [Cohnella sp. REN36]MCC3374873.1 aspartyl-phosphate phosphatase Spo0E family protein [Cohnella sp. REN36]
MATAEPHNDLAKASARMILSAPDHTGEAGGSSPLIDKSLEEEINTLRRRMTETFIREASFTSEPVMEISRLLDLKINEYMRQICVFR